MLAWIASENELRDKNFKVVERDVNNTENKTTRRTPFELLHGYKPKYHGSILRYLHQPTKGWHPPEKLQDEARQNIQEAQINMKKYFDQKRCNGLRFELGEIVAMQRQPTPGESTKLQTSLSWTTPNNRDITNWHL